MPQKLPSDAPPPRRCVIEKLPGENEYGYNLHAEKNRGQFVGLVDAGSPAQRGGLLQGDRIFAVNGHSIIGENHKKVVERIKAQPERCEMLVLSEDGVKWYQDQNIQITLDVLEQALENSKLQETPVFVPPPPPPTQHYDPMAPLPRLAKLEKSFPDQEFGFNLHAEREKGHFIGIVDENGIGQKAGLEMGQRIVGVNGKLIYPNTGHKEVVALIKKSPMSTTLLVVSEETDKWHRDHGVAYSFDHYEQPPTHPIEVETHHHEEVHATPAKTNGYEVAPAPHSIQVNEEREISKLTTTTKTEVISTNTASYQYKETTETYNAYDVPPAETSDDLMAQVFGKVDLPAVGNQVTIQSHTKELSTEDASSVSSLSSHRESAVDVPVNHQYVPSYVSQSHHHEDRHSQTQTHHHQNQQPSPLSNGSSHGYAPSSTSGYDDDDIYHLSAKEARERLRMKNRKHHMHEMSLTEKYQLVSNM